VEEFMASMDPGENKGYKELVKALDGVGVGNRELVEAASFTNAKYPNLEVEFEVEGKDEVTAGSPANLSVKVTRETDEDDEEEEVDTTVHAPFYPGKKMENWWLVVAEEKTKSLLAIKRVTIARELKVKLEYVVPEPGRKGLTLFLMCDSYSGVDQSLGFEVDVGEGMEDDDEDDSEEGE